MLIGVSQAVDTNTTVGANGGGDANTTVPASSVSEPGTDTQTPSIDTNKVTPPVLQMNGDLDGGKVVNTQPTYAAMVTTPGALMAAAPLPPQVIVTTIDPGKFYETLDEILEDVESLADQKQTANEGKPIINICRNDLLQTIFLEIFLATSTDLGFRKLVV